MGISLGTNKKRVCILPSLSLKNVLNIEVIPSEEAARGVVEKVPHTTLLTCYCKKHTAISVLYRVSGIYAAPLPTSPVYPMP